MKNSEKSTVNSRRTTVKTYLSSVVSGLLTLLLLNLFSCTQNKTQAVQEKYTCPMHPEIIRDKPGTCPICFMDLVKIGAAADDGSLVLNESQIKLANIS